MTATYPGAQTLAANGSRVRSVAAQTRSAATRFPA